MNAASRSWLRFGLQKPTTIAVSVVARPRANGDVAASDYDRDCVVPQLTRSSESSPDGTSFASTAPPTGDSNSEEGTHHVLA